MNAISAEGAVDSRAAPARKSGSKREHAVQEKFSCEAQRCGKNSLAP